MSDALKTLNNLRSLRALARDLSLEQLEAIAEKLTQVVAEKREAVKAEAEAQAQRLANLNKYKALLAQDGISPEELVAALGCSTTESKKRESRPAKYQYINEKGEHKTWTGQGRTPLAIQKALEAGKSLKSFEI